MVQGVQVSAPFGRIAPALDVLEELIPGRTRSQISPRILRYRASSRSKPRLLR